MVAMDRPSISFSWFLDSMKIERDEGDPSGRLIMYCATCEESICDVEEGDNLRVLFNTGLAHRCEAE